MERSTVSDIKRAQKEKLLMREISKLFTQISLDEPDVRSLTLTHVKLTPDKSTVFVYFYTPEGAEKFNELVDILKIYKPSMRTAIAQSTRLRYTPEIRFKFDVQFEKQARIETLLDTVKEEE